MDNHRYINCKFAMSSNDGGSGSSYDNSHNFNNRAGAGGDGDNSDGANYPEGLSEAHLPMHYTAAPIPLIRDALVRVPDETDSDETDDHSRDDERGGDQDGGEAVANAAAADDDADRTRASRARRRAPRNGVQQNVRGIIFYLPSPNAYKSQLRLQGKRRKGIKIARMPGFLFRITEDAIFSKDFPFLKDYGFRISFHVCQ